MSDNLHFEDMGPVEDDVMSEGEEEYDNYVTMKVGEKRFLTKDEGIEKELLVEGSEDFEQPEKGDEVFGELNAIYNTRCTHEKTYVAISTLLPDNLYGKESCC
eukprot:5229131-Pyramimonas_sp.AAC.7